MYFFSFSGRHLIVFLGFVGVTANNIASLILEVEVCGNRTWYYVYRFIFALIQIALAIAFKTHLFVLTGLSSILFHIFLTVVRPTYTCPQALTIARATNTTTTVTWTNCGLTRSTRGSYLSSPSCSNLALASSWDLVS